MDIVKSLRPVALATLVCLGVGGYLFTSLAVNGQPEMSGYSGWVAIVGKDVSAKDQVRLTVEAIEAGAPGEHPQLAYSVVVCGPDPFEGLLLTGGDARLTADESGGVSTGTDMGLGARLKSAPIGDLTVSWAGGGPATRLVGVESAPLKFESLPACLADSMGAADGSFTGSPAFLIGRARAPIRRAVSLGPTDGPRSSLNFPLVGGLPGIPRGARGVFNFSGAMTGEYSAPISQMNYVSAGGLSAVADVDEVFPAPVAERSLSWSSFVPIAPWIRVVDTGQMSWWQSLQVATAIILGVATSVLASLLLRDGNPASISGNMPTEQIETSNGGARSGGSSAKGGSDSSATRLSPLVWVATVLIVLWATRRRSKHVRSSTH